MTPLGREIAETIAADGPMPLDRYMALCLGHPRYGYYPTRLSHLQINLAKNRPHFFCDGSHHH
jgi:SAM-dependent MidA family methyltransferase